MRRAAHVAAFAALWSPLQALSAITSRRPALRRLGVARRGRRSAGGGPRGLRRPPAGGARLVSRSPSSRLAARSTRVAAFACGGHSPCCVPASLGRCLIGVRRATIGLPPSAGAAPGPCLPPPAWRGRARSLLVAGRLRCVPPRPARLLGGAAPVSLAASARCRGLGTSRQPTPSACHRRGGAPGVAICTCGPARATYGATRPLALRRRASGRRRPSPACAARRLPAVSSSPAAAPATARVARHRRVGAPVLPLARVGGVAVPSRPRPARLRARRRRSGAGTSGPAARPTARHRVVAAPPAVAPRAPARVCASDSAAFGPSSAAVVHRTRHVPTAAPRRRVVRRSSTCPRLGPPGPPVGPPWPPVAPPGGPPAAGLAPRSAALTRSAPVAVPATTTTAHRAATAPPPVCRAVRSWLRTRGSAAVGALRHAGAPLRQPRRLRRQGHVAAASRHVVGTGRSARAGRRCCAWHRRTRRPARDDRLLSRSRRFGPHGGRALAHRAGRGPGHDHRDVRACQGLWRCPRFRDPRGPGQRQDHVHRHQAARGVRGGGQLKVARPARR